MGGGPVYPGMKIVAGCSSMSFNAWIIAGTVLVVAGVFLVTRFGSPQAR